jgi:phosphonopyruvate decarboxylase
LAIGNYLISKKATCVYMQNSGLTNAINPLVSILNSQIYNVPMVLLIGWRGAPDIKDEPQHKLIGSITKQILRNLKIDFHIILIHLT